MSFVSFLRTTALLGLLTGILLGVGFFFAGRGGLIMALIFAFIMNFTAYWYSDKIVLSMYRAKEVSKDANPRLHEMVERLSKRANIPKPKIYMGGNPATSHLFIVNPFKSDRFTNLFSTHPPVESRVQRLKELARTL